MNLADTALNVVDPSCRCEQSERFAISRQVWFPTKRDVQQQQQVSKKNNFGSVVRLDADYTTNQTPNLQLHGHDDAARGPRVLQVAY